MKAGILTGIAVLAVSLAGAQPLGLQNCIDHALKNNREILIGAGQTDIAKVEKKSAWAQLTPQVDATAGLDHYWKIPVQVLPGEILGQPGTFIPVRMGTPWMGDYGLEASLKLIDPQSWQNIKLARLKLQAAESSEEALEKALIRNVKMAFYQAQQQKKQAEISAARLNAYKETHQLINDRFEKGLTDKIVFNQSLSLLKDREEALSTAKAELSSAMLDLKFWMGFPLQQELEINTEQEENKIPRTQEATFQASLLPDYTTRKLQLDLAGRQYKSTLSQLYPSLRLMSSYRNIGFGSNIDFIGNSKWYTTGYVGVELRLPILALNKMAYNPQKQKAEMKIAGLEFENYLQEQESRYSKEKILLQSAWESVQNRKENVALAEENEKLGRQKIENGILDMTQFKQIQQDLYLAQEKLHRSELNFLKHYVEIQYLQNR